jgi:hypothetical protein
MFRSKTIAVATAALLAGFGSAFAQSINPQFVQPDAPPPQGPAAALPTGPEGARYYPGVGFRYVLPPNERVHSYYAGGPRVYGYYSTGSRVYGRSAQASNRCRGFNAWLDSRCPW